MPARIIAIVNQKGGVGKTTTATNLGAALANKNYKTLLIDLDAQANLSAHNGVLSEDSQESRPSMYEVLRGQVGISDIIVKISGNKFIAPASLFLSAADLELGGVIGRESLLRKALREFSEGFDFVLIDCPPSLGLLSLNGLVAATEVVIPVQSEFLALHGVRQLLDTIDQVRLAYNPELRIGGVLVCLHDGRRRLSRSIEETVREYFGDLAFKTVVRTNVALAEAPASGGSIFEYDIRSSGAEDYEALAEEVIQRGTQKLVS